MRVSIIVPVIREESFKKCYEAIKANAGIPEDQYEIRHMIDSKRVGCPHVVKWLTEVATKDRTTDAICFLGDDTIPSPDFLKYAIEDMSAFPGGWGVIGIRDQQDDRLTPSHWLMHRKMLPYLNGEPFHTGYIHCYCDNELMDRAKRLGRYMMSIRASLIHNHPTINHNLPMDEDYKRVYAPDVLSKDRWTYQRRKEEGFMKILVCGNGPSLPAQLRNNHLLNFDKVVRINNWEYLPGDAYSQRCDAWVVYPRHDIRHKENGKVKYDILAHSKRARELWLAHPICQPDFIRFFSRDPDHELSFTERDRFCRMSGLAVPTTGVLALRMAQLITKNVWAAGFDFYQGERWHYYNNEKIPGGHFWGPHDPPLNELAWFNGEVQEGRIHVL